jgi:hypothetical protein
MSAKRSYSPVLIKGPTRIPVLTKGATERPKQIPIKRTGGRGRRVPQKKNAPIISLVVLGALLLAYGSLWLPALRIQKIQVEGYSGPAIESVVRDQMHGLIGILFPKDSSLFYPEKSISASIINTLPEVKEVEISRSSFTSLYVDVVSRVKKYVWCGDGVVAVQETSLCYFMDDTGYVFKEAGSAAVFANDPSIVRIETKLTNSSKSGTPLGETAVAADSMPALSDFVTKVSALLAPVRAIIIRADEVDVVLSTDTRLTYIVEQEEKAFKLLTASAVKIQKDLRDLEYVDARFDGKIYLKRKGSVSVNE